MFGKNEPGVLEKWSRLLTRTTAAPADEIPDEFVSAEELSPWAAEPEPTTTNITSTVRSQKNEGLIARYGSEIRSALGPGTLIEGKFAFDSPVRIDGTLRGEVHSSSLLVVGEEGSIEGLVCVGNLIVFGRVKGHIVADEVVQIASSGDVQAEIETAQIAIDLGGAFQGSVKRQRA